MVWLIGLVLSDYGWGELWVLLKVLALCHCLAYSEIVPNRCVHPKGQGLRVKKSIPISLLIPNHRFPVKTENHTPQYTRTHTDPRTHT